MNKNYVLETVTVMKDVKYLQDYVSEMYMYLWRQWTKETLQQHFYKKKKLTKYEKLRRIGHVKDFNKLMLYFLCAEGPTIVSLNSILSQATANILSNLILLPPKESVKLTSGQKMLIEQQIHPQSRLDFNCLIFLWHKTVKLDVNLYVAAKTHMYDVLTIISFQFNNIFHKTFNSNMNCYYASFDTSFSIIQSSWEDRCITPVFWITM